MKYELAKELKNAGFPQAKRPATYFDGRVGDELVYYPTLEELIDACGEKFGRLQLSGAKFHAIDDDGTIWGIETSPSEAVANLWISLHNGGNGTKADKNTKPD